MNNKLIPVALAIVVLAGCDNGRDNRAQPNAAPVLSAIADQATSANGPSAAIGFSVIDEDATSVSFTLMSDDQDVVGEDAIVLGGGGANRSITVTPTPDTTGDALITIIGTDTGGLSASTAFLLTVAAEQKSMQQFTRATFADSADGEPELVNAVEFAADAEADDFADLLAQ